MRLAQSSFNFQKGFEEEAPHYRAFLVSTRRSGHFITNSSKKATARHAPSAKNMEAGYFTLELQRQFLPELIKCPNDGEGLALPRIDGLLSITGVHQFIRAPAICQDL